MDKTSVSLLAKKYGVSKEKIQQTTSQTADIHGTTEERILDILTVDRLSNLPAELLQMVMQFFDCKTLIRFCTLSKTIRSICEDETFWHMKLRMDFPSVKPTEKSAREIYFQLCQRSKMTLLIAVGEKNGILDSFIIWKRFGSLKTNLQRFKEIFVPGVEITHGRTFFELHQKEALRLTRIGNAPVVKSTGSQLYLYLLDINVEEFMIRKEKSAILLCYWDTENDILNIKPFASKKEMKKWISEGHLQDLIPDIIEDCQEGDPTKKCYSGLYEDQGIYPFQEVANNIYGLEQREEIVVKDTDSLFFLKTKLENRSLVK